MPRRRNNRARKLTVRLRESAAVLDRPAAALDLAESASIPAAGCKGKRKYRACLIQGDRWGSRGYYSGSMLAAYGPMAWPAGTQMYLDHPSLTEESDRPERSIRDLAGKIASTPVYQPEGPQGPGLYADVDVYPHAAEIVDALADDIGLSIRASGTGEPGTKDGRSGLVITSIAASPTNSVDYVTRAGAGGKLVALLESARPAKPADSKPMTVRIQEAGSIGAWFEARIHSEFTEQADDSYGWGELSRDERIALSGAIGDALDAFVARLQADAPQLYQRDRWGDTPSHPAEPETQDDGEEPTDMQMAESATAVSEPEPPAEPTNSEEAPVSGSQTGPAPGAETNETTAATQLAEAQRITALEAELAEAKRVAEQAATELAEAKAREVRATNESAARTAVTAAMASATCPIDQRARAAVTPLVEAAALAHVATLTTAVDQAALDQAIAAAITAEQARVAQLAEAFGVGAVAGVGTTTTGVTAAPVDTAQVRTQLIETYRARGMSESAATIAADGR